jgi:hypothetical protein
VLVRVTDAVALYEQFGRHGVWLADLAGAERDLRPAPRGAQVLPFIRTGS